MFASIMKKRRMRGMVGNDRKRLLLTLFTLKKNLIINELVIKLIKQQGSVMGANKSNKSWKVEPRLLRAVITRSRSSSG